MEKERLTPLFADLDKKEVYELVKQVSRESFAIGCKLGGFVSDFIDEVFDMFNSNNTNNYGNN